VSAGTLTRDTRTPAPGRRAAVGRFALDRDVVMLALLIAIAAFLRFWRLRHQGFWFDEANTSQEVHYRPGQMLSLLKHYESTPPLYYGVAWVWARIFGYGEAGLRSLSAVCGVLVVPVSYVLARKLFTRRAGLIAAALTASNPLLIWYSQEARAYELVVLLSGISLIAFAYAKDEPTPGALATWTVASALAIATEYYAALVIIPQALWLLYRHRGARTVIAGIAVLVVWCLPLLWFAISQHGTGHAKWIAPIPLGHRIGEIFPQFLIGFGAPGGDVLSRVAEVAAVAALLLLAVRVRRGEARSGAALAGGIVVVAIVLNALLIAAGIDNLLSRNVIELWLPLAALVAAGLAIRGRAAIAGLALAAALCGIGVAAAVGVALNRHYQRPDWRGVVRVLGVQPSPGVSQRAILIQLYRDVLPLSLYMPGLKAWTHHGTDKYNIYTGTNPVDEFEVVSMSSPPGKLCWWGSACNLEATQLQSAYKLPGFRPVWIRHFEQFTILRLRAQHPVVVSPQMVSAALTNTNLIYDDLLLQR
jgi:4-amino-4-deoxy-L-arabinose transferase-like glycosyltransferase